MVAKAEWRLSSTSVREDDEEAKATLNKLSSRDRARFMQHGELPRYSHALLGVHSESHPIAAAVKDADRALTAPPRAPAA